MLGTLVTAVVAALSEMSGLVSSTSQVGVIIKLLTQIIPVAAQVAQDLIQPIKNIIAALKLDPNTTVQQLQDLATLDAATDAAFEAAATAAQAEDAAASGGTNPAPAPAAAPSEAPAS